MAKKTHKSPEAARNVILDAAEEIVVAVGPAGLRISAVAKKAGMAHPNLIHHFGSREGLLEALAVRVGGRATERITGAISAALHAAPEDRVKAMTHVLDVAYQGNEGKLAVWLHLSGAESSLKANMQEIVELSHQLRKSIDGKVSYANTNRLVMLVTLALVGEVVSGPGVKDALGFGKQENKRAHFHQWLAEILLNLSDAELNTSLGLLDPVDKIAQPAPQR
ncbi:MAG: TetR/AcrR family transcriptional regulator [Gammaproteobacteria bacterium]|nr:TetR/AcrR family transcriptional regulator [Gammaproteobacteria bacterium]